jgi:hypothetical protein
MVKLRAFLDAEAKRNANVCLMRTSNLDTIPGAPRGIHKRYCNLSRTVWENAGKTNETLAEIYL